MYFIFFWILLFVCLLLLQGQTTALHVVAKRGRIDVARLLLEHGANPNHINIYGRTAMSCAVLGSVEMVNLLIQHGGCLNLPFQSEFSPLHEACQSGKCSMVQQLIARGANVNKDSTLGPPLFVAIRKGSQPMTKLLVEYGALLNAQPLVLFL
eukprot:c10296_g1_i1.p1 GENE.c10296_g1_i1~~c10296_g1_i1.p1  ORF type:complete len:153 (+),score=28.15 c10296_g1_i1:292-750(+)